MVVRSLLKFALAAGFLVSLTGCPDDNKAATAAVDGRCEHGVQKELCARCNPALAAAFKAKNDWCEEHSRPESQCVVCHPDLAKQGIK